MRRQVGLRVGKHTVCNDYSRAAKQLAELLSRLDDDGSRRHCGCRIGGKQTTSLMRKRLAVEVKGQKSTLLINDKHNVSQAVAGLQLPPVHKISKPFELACLGKYLGIRT